MVINSKWLLALIDERGGMTKDEVKQACRTRDSSATSEEIRLARKRLHWNEMVILDASGCGPGKYMLTDYGREALVMNDKTFKRALVK